MSARVLISKAFSTSPLLHLVIYGLLGPLMTYLPVMLVFTENAESGLWLTSVVLIGLVLSISNPCNLVLTGLLFGAALFMLDIQSVSVPVLWVALTSGAVMSSFGFQELAQEEQLSDLLPTSEDHRLVTTQKLLELTRHQLKSSNLAAEKLQAKSLSLKEKIKQSEHLFEEQNAQIAELFNAVRKGESMQQKLSQLGKGEEALLSKACAYDQLREQFVEKKEVIDHLRSNLYEKELELEVKNKEHMESLEESTLIDLLQHQLSNALGKLEKGRLQERLLLDLLSTWSHPKG